MCNARVFEMSQAYVCEKAVGPEKTCDFRSGRVILLRPIERTQMQKLLSTGKTDLLQFVSARTKRGLSAFLVRQPDGKIGFQFEVRDATKGGAASAGTRKARKAPAKTVAKQQAPATTIAKTRTAKPAATPRSPRGAVAGAKSKPKTRSRRTSAK